MAWLVEYSKRVAFGGRLEYPQFPCLFFFFEISEVGLCQVHNGSEIWVLGATPGVVAHVVPFCQLPACSHQPDATMANGLMCVLAVSAAHRLFLLLPLVSLKYNFSYNCSSVCSIIFMSLSLCPLTPFKTLLSFSGGTKSRFVDFQSFVGFLPPQSCMVVPHPGPAGAKPPALRPLHVLKMIFYPNSWAWLTIFSIDCKSH